MTRSPKRTEFRPCWRVKCGMSLHPAGNIQLRVPHRPIDLQRCCVGTLSQITERSAERRVRQKTGWLAGGPLLCVATIKADSHIACRAHAAPMPCPCHSPAMPCVNSHIPCRSPALLQQCPALRESPRGSRKYPNC